MSVNSPSWPRVLILPGLYNSGPQHWQSRWEMLHPSFSRVVQREWHSPDCEEWLATLDAAINESGEPALLVAHSTACCLVARWSEHHNGPVRGALLVAPADSEAPSYPPEPTGFQPMPCRRLPFPSIMVTSNNDPYVRLDRAQTFAANWGSQLIEIGARGHINGESGLDDWPAGLMLLRELALVG